MNLIKKVDPMDINVVMVDIDMFDVTNGQGPKQKDIKMVDISEEAFILDKLDTYAIEPEP